MSSNLAQISGLVGFLLPLVVAVIQRQTWSNTFRTIVGVAACAVAAVITAWAESKLNLHNFATSALVIFTLTKTSYLAVWKPSGVAPVIEEKTS